MSRLRDVTGTNPTVYSLAEQCIVYLFPFPITQIAGLFSFLSFKMNYNAIYLLILVEVQLHVPYSDLSSKGRG